MNNELEPVYWYRYHDYRTAAPLNEWDQPCGDGSPALSLQKLFVTKVTPKGVWLEGHKFVLRDAHKRYACPTIEEAEISFRKRKARQRSIILHQLKHIDEVLALLEKRKQVAA